MHYCCWPCVCDTQDFIKVDTKTVTLRGGIQKTFYFAVIGNPCDHPEKLNKPFYQPFDGRETTLSIEARELQCASDGTLIGATLSDGGYPIISMFFDGEIIEHTEAIDVASESPQPGRITTRKSDGVLFQHEREYAHMCQERANNGYNSGMGEIFRRAASIASIERKNASVVCDDQPCGPLVADKSKVDL